MRSVLRLIGFTTVVAVVLLHAAPLLADAQAGKIWRIGYLTHEAAEAVNPARVSFRQRLRELGYVEGQNIALEMRAAEGTVERFPVLAAELVRLKVDVIVAGGDPATAAAQRATRSIPIVMVGASDPVSSGFVTSLARPGSNITGLTSQSQDLASKTLQLLKEAVPNLSQVAVLLDPVPGAAKTFREMEVAAPALGLQLQALKVRSPSELDGAFATATSSKAGAAVILARTFWLNRALIAELANKRRLPTAGMLPAFAQAGWLLGYGPTLSDQGTRAAEIVDRTLKGAKPADLPVEQPTKFELAINLKTAKAIGLTIRRRSCSGRIR
jgi:putative tryptophan/tyrosine transport system substrate-binding protein